MGLLKYPVVDGLKLCGKCGLKLPVESFAPARKHFQYACRECRRQWAKEYRGRPQVKEAMLDYSRQYRGVPENRSKLNLKTRIHRKNPSARVKVNASRRAWAAREKQKAVNYKGGVCICCGYFECLAALDFHHRDPSQKEGYGTGALKSHWSFERNKPEIDKCELVCVRCHREIHAGFRKLYP